MTPRIFLTASILILGALAFTGCNKDKGASERALDGLQQAREGIATAQESMKAMQTNTDALKEEMAEHTAKINALIEKRIELSREEAALIAARAKNGGGDAAKKLEEMNARQAKLEEALKTYRDAPPADAVSARSKLNEAMGKFDGARAELIPVLTPAASAPPPSPEPAPIREREPEPEPIAKPEPEPEPAPAPPAEPERKPEAAPASAPAEPAPVPEQ